RPALRSRGALAVPSATRATRRYRRLRGFACEPCCGVGRLRLARRFTLQRIRADFPGVVRHLRHSRRVGARMMRTETGSDVVLAAARMTDGQRSTARPEDVYALPVGRVLDHPIGKAPAAHVERHGAPFCKSATEEKSLRFAACRQR